MTRHETFPTSLSTDRPITLAILAMGGQGGGVLADWIVGMAEAQGWTAQSTSVPGVAQRTGATIYYIEMVKAPDGVHPILALMPTPGDVDVVLAAEFMEAGRSILRGLVTPDRTTLIASTHRAYAIAEKQKPGDGAADPQAVVTASGVAAKRVIASDLDKLAARHGSVISASLFGSLAGAGVLPFPREAFEEAIRAGGKGVNASLAAFAAAYDRAQNPDAASAEPAEAIPPKADPLAPVGHPGFDALLARVRGDLPAEVRLLAAAGLRKVVDFQDLAYGEAYLARLADLLAADRAAGGADRGFAFTAACAKYLAVAMAYDDVIRVADLKTRGSRRERVSREVGVKEEEILYTTEFMHPRMEEVIGTMPAALGRWFEARPGLVARLDRFVSRGRRVRTGTIRWYLALYVVAGLKRIRLRTLRHSREAAHVDVWLGRALDVLPRNYALAVEIIGCRRLVKGYSDTHARGEAKFDRVLSAVPMLVDREDGADWLRRLKQAALMDEGGLALDGALKTVATLGE
ncbi:indolepyruvate oxidoreductase subunit beta family protein [Salinarimonas ramus]|uniref:Indolepyruvate oxidoreductase n=1 Tax=Salinarimonas ramus TaxID=690164 RepID=A0A917V609_9HYPH|nr:indolepyruvate oxidoreductase subunit beta family protein [Salinarimonas ramus]GGK42882.1 indolepyruvate oxidoreductase [Salinarimonas ramus]